MSDQKHQSCSNVECSSPSQTQAPGPHPFQQDRAAVALRLGDVKHKIAVISGKGGVGKTTVSVNLATALALSGKKVGLLDADLHGPSVPFMLGLTGRMPQASAETVEPLSADWGLKIISIALFLSDQDDAVIWRGPMKIAAIKQFLSDVNWGQLDYLLIDCPPGTGDEPLSVVQLVPDPTGAIIVTTPQELSQAVVRKSITFCQKVNMPIIGLIENMSGYLCPHCDQISYPFSRGGGEALSSYAQEELLASIPLSADVSPMADNGRPVALDRENPVGAIFHQVAEQLPRLLIGPVNAPAAR